MQNYVLSAVQDHNYQDQYIMDFRRMQNYDLSAVQEHNRQGQDHNSARS